MTDVYWSIRNLEGSGYVLRGWFYYFFIVVYRFLVMGYSREGLVYFF